MDDCSQWQIGFQSQKIKGGGDRNGFAVLPVIPKQGFSTASLGSVFEKGMKHVASRLVEPHLIVLIAHAIGDPIGSIHRDGDPDIMADAEFKLGRGGVIAACRFQFRERDLADEKGPFLQLSRGHLPVLGVVAARVPPVEGTGHVYFVVEKVPLRVEIRVEQKAKMAVLDVIVGEAPEFRHRGAADFAERARFGAEEERGLAVIRFPVFAELNEYSVSGLPVRRLNEVMVGHVACVFQSVELRSPL